MNKIIKIILTIVNILAILGALATIGYFWGYKALEKNIMQKGFDIAISQIAQSVTSSGQVQISKDLILIAKPNAVEPTTK